ncbi:MAG: insulinase family protein, partial [Muribaculaceae bacterium]|nr:insulinase family protein [Muribaculaceae bacterium]
NNRDKKENETITREIVRTFIDGVPMLDPQQELSIKQMLTQAVSLDDINNALKELVTDNNRVVSVMLPEVAGNTLPTEAEIAAALAAVDAENIEPFVDQVKAEPLIPALPAPGKITKTETLDKWGAQQWTLSNGVKVVVKPTEFKADEILMDAQALGGTSVFGNDYASSIKFMPYALSQHGLGEYTYKDLQKYLQGKQCNVSYNFSDYTRDITGTTTPKDLKNMMELLYMSFTNLAIMPDEFQAVQKTFSGVLQNQEKTPDYIFNERISENLYEAPVKQPLTVADIQAATPAQTLEMVSTLTAHAADYTFYFVGSLTLEEFRPLVEQYIATLPADAASTTKAPVFPASMKAYKNAPAVAESKCESTTPQTYVFTIAYAELPFTAKERAAILVAGQIMSQRILEQVREEWGASYSPGAGGMMSRVSNGANTLVLTQFPMKPEMKDKVVDYLKQAYIDMEKGVTAEELGKVKEYMVKKTKQSKEENNGWLNGMTGEALNGVDTFLTGEEVYNSLTPADIQAAMKALNDAGTYRVVLMDAIAPEAK